MDMWTPTGICAGQEKPWGRQQDRCGAINVRLSDYTSVLAAAMLKHKCRLGE